MIRLPKVPAPEVLSGSAVRRAREDLMAYLRRPPAERALRRPPIAEELFFEPELRSAIERRSRGRCAYCETGGSGGPRHFRPIQIGETHHRPDEVRYAWLAYEWDNLLHVCFDCDRAKHDAFPLQGPAAEFPAPLREVRRTEAPLLLDPIHDYPLRHLTFLADGRCEGTSVRGQATVDILELNRPHLVKVRAQDVRKLCDTILDEPDGWSRDLVEPELDVFPGSRTSYLSRIVARLAELGRAPGPRARSHPEAALAYYRGALGSDLHAQLREIIARLVEEDQRRPPITAARPVYELSAPDRAMAPSARELYERRPSVQIAKLELRDFKGLRELFVLGKAGREKAFGAPCLMLLGENAAGKSSVLQAIALALVGGPAARALRLDPGDYLRDPGRYSDEAAADHANGRSAQVHVQLLGGDVFSMEIEPGGRLRRRRFRGAPEPATLVLGYGPRRYFDERLSTRRPGAHTRVETLFKPLSTLPFPQTWLNGLDDAQFAAVARAMRKVLNLTDDDDLVRDDRGRICLRVAEVPIPITRLSEGYRSLFTMLADIFRELLALFDNLEDAHAVVLIDEIETHLHPRWKMRVMTALRRALPRVQFIVTTHDPLCLRGMEDGEVVVLQRTADGAIAVLQDLPSLAGMRAEQLLTSDYFGLFSTVDPATELEFARFAEGTMGSDPAVARTVTRLTLGDTAGEQVMQDALARFIAERDRPTGALRPDVRAEAVRAVFDALNAPLTPRAE